MGLNRNPKDLNTLGEFNTLNFDMIEMKDKQHEYRPYLWSTPDDLGRNEMRVRELENHLEVYTYRFSHLQNATIKRLTKGRLRFRNDGAVLVVKRNGSADGPNSYLDVTKDDFSDVVDYFTAWGDPLSDAGKWTRHWALNESQSGIKAVNILCEGMKPTPSDRRSW